MFRRISTQALGREFDEYRWPLNAEVRRAVFFRGAAPREPGFFNLLFHLIHLRGCDRFVHDSRPFAG